MIAQDAKIPQDAEIPTAVVAQDVEVDDSTAGVSRSLLCSLSNLYTAAKSNYLPASAASSLECLESGVTSVAGVVEPYVSTDLARSMEEQLDNLVAPQVNRLAKVAQVAKNLSEMTTDKVRPHAERIEKKLLFAYDASVSAYERADAAKKSAYERADAVKKSAYERAEAAKKSAADRLTAIALNSLQRVDAAVEYALPDTAVTEQARGEEEAKEADHQEQQEGDGKASPAAEQQLTSEADQAEIESIVERSVALADKVNKRLQKRVWTRMASAQGFAMRKRDVIHTSLVDYASAVVDRAVSPNIKALSAAIVQFPSSASNVYSHLAEEAGDADVGVADFQVALIEAMADLWHESLAPAASAYVEVINRLRRTRAQVVSARIAAIEYLQQLLDTAHVAEKAANTRRLLEKSLHRLLGDAVDVATVAEAEATDKVEQTEVVDGVVAGNEEEQVAKEVEQETPAVEEDVDVDVQVSDKLINIPEMAAGVYRDLNADGTAVEFDAFLGNLRVMVTDKGMAWAKTLDGLARRVYDKLVAEYADE